MFRKFVVTLCCVSLLVLPMRRAEAFVAPAPLVTVITAGGPVAWTVAGLSALVAAGAVIYAIAFKDQGGNEVARVTLNPKAPRPVPPGWTAAANPWDDAVPQSSIAATTVYSVSGCTGTFASREDAALNHWMACDGTSIHGTGCSVTSVAGNVVSGSCTDRTPSGGAGPYAFSSTVSQSNNCPAGYTLSGSSCNLTNASLVPYPPDGIAQKKVVSGVIVDDSRDPDVTTGAPGVTQTDTMFSVKGSSSTATVKINGDGTTTTTVTTPNGNGTSSRVALSAAAADSGATDGGTHATTLSNATVLGEGNTTDTDSATSVVTCTNCATEVTQQGVKSDLDALKSNGIKQDEQAASWSTPKAQADSKIADASTAADSHKQKFLDASGNSDASRLGVSGLTQYTPPTSGDGTGIPGLFPETATCAPMSLSFMSRTFTVDYCTVANGVRIVLEWGLYAVTFLYCLLLFYRRGQEA